MKHVIKKQIVEMQLQNAANAFSMQHKMSNYYHVVMKPLLDKIFDELTASDETIQIDSLTLDFGDISMDELELNALPKGIYQSLFNQIQGFVSKSRSGQSNAGNVQVRKSAASQWIYYMQHGFLPWNTMEVSPAWYEQVLAIFATDFESVTLLRKLLLSDATALIRVILQHPETFLVRLVEILTSQNQRQLELALNEIARIWIDVLTLVREPGTQNKQQFSREVWVSILKLSASGRTGLTTEILIANILEPYLKSKEEIKLIWQKVGTELKITSPVFNKIIRKKGFRENIIKNEISKDRKEASTRQQDQHNESGIAPKWFDSVHEKPTNRITNSGKPVDDPSKDVDQSTLSNNQNLSVANNNTSRKSKNNPNQFTSLDVDFNISGQKNSEELEVQHLDDEKFVLHDIQKQSIETLVQILEVDGVFVQHAGVVLLHPFLAHFFKIIHLVENGHFVNHALHQKALYIIHYLATGCTVSEKNMNC
jgi:hypothetical protein